MMLLAEPPCSREHFWSRAAALSMPEATHGRRSMSWALETGTRLDQGAAPRAGLSRRPAEITSACLQWE